MSGLMEDNIDQTETHTETALRLEQPEAWSEEAIEFLVLTMEVSAGQLAQVCSFYSNAGE